MSSTYDSREAQQGVLVANGSPRRQSPWRQGSVIPRELLDSGALPNDLDPDAKLIVISQDCDVVHPSYNVEPFVEYFIARRITSRDGRRTRGKNPRFLQFEALINGDGRLFEINANEKFRIDRWILDRGDPEAGVMITPGQIRALARWAAKRYNRSSFPTGFDQRISARVREKIEKLMTRYGGDISGTFIAFLSSDGELREEDAYKILVHVVAQKEAFDGGVREADLLKVKAELTTLLGQCSGIELVETVELDSESEFSLDDYFNTRLWDYEYVSDAEQDEHGGLP